MNIFTKCSICGKDLYVTDSRINCLDIVLSVPPCDCMSDEWNNASTDQPPFGEYVIGLYCGGNWISHDKDGNEVNEGKHNLVVVKCIKDKVEDNNERPYRWIGNNGNNYFGQDIEKWKHQSIPKGANMERTI